MIAGCGADLLINICLTCLGTLLRNSPSPKSQNPHLPLFHPRHTQHHKNTTTTPLSDIMLTGLSRTGYFPGHIHAFYCEYIYYNRKDQAAQGVFENRHAPGVYSDNVQTGGRGYGAMGAN